jgi:hypothetical protein
MCRKYLEPPYRMIIIISGANDGVLPWLPPLSDWQLVRLLLLLGQPTDATKSVSGFVPFLFP